MKKIIVTLIAFTAVSGFAQQRTCGTMDKVSLLKATVPGFEAHHNEVMNYIQNPDNAQARTIFNRGGDNNTPNVVVTIPVVFHVLYKNAAQNISDAQINSQLAVLNADYRKLNADFNTVVPSVFRPLGADVEITFCKATRTPAGATSTGITRKSVSSSFVFENSYYLAAGEPAWDPTKYLNIWIGRFTDDQLLGFAYLPSNAGQADDGLCIGDQYFGTTGTATAPFNKGRTGTHEIGHYFGLLHPWGDDGSPCGSGANSDGVADTPATDNPYFNCPSFPSNANACTNTTNGSMFMNYMDYVNDACMAFFTAGQKTIMQNTLAGPRLSLLTSNGCATLGLSDFEAMNAISVYPNPVSQYFMITSPQSQIDEVEIFNNIGQLVKTQKLTSQTNNVVNIDGLASGTYYLRIYNEGKLLKSDKIIKK
ncbi:MAG TPA: M43 family zinc metalloprotease [Flavobacterium sp.]|nr:M43 family zinc metalloprotease [Flavobacterium sp.]HPJ11381.1 M43 family zinc metalloprotease [Flavobacterium sp.]